MGRKEGPPRIGTEEERGWDNIYRDSLSVSRVSFSTEGKDNVWKVIEKG